MHTFNLVYLIYLFKENVINKNFQESYIYFCYPWIYDEFQSVLDLIKYSVSLFSQVDHHLIYWMNRIYIILNKWNKNNQIGLRVRKSMN